MNDHFYVCPSEIAQRFNIDVIEDNSLEPSCYGYCKIEEDGRGVIAYNPTLSELQKRFSIAHMIGHFLLGHFTSENKKKFVETHENFDEFAPIMEDEANRFALKILIPRDKLEFLIFKKGIASPKEMARILKVSEIGLVHMLKEYGYLEK